MEREFYINDAGNQVNKFGASLEARYLQLYKGEEAVPFPEDGYKGEDIIAHAKGFAQENGDKYVEAPARSAGPPWWPTPCPRTSRAFTTTWPGTGGVRQLV